MTNISFSVELGVTDIDILLKRFIQALCARGRLAGSLQNDITIKLTVHSSLGCEENKKK